MNNKSNWLYEKRKFVFAGFAVVILILTLSVVFKPKPAVKLESEPLEPGQTEIQNTDELRKVVSDNQIAALAEDIGYFAMNTLEKYKAPAPNGIVFTTDGKVKTIDGGKLEVSGKYSEYNDAIIVQLLLKKNERFDVSITDQTGNTNIDSQLPSNSKANQYIATLPVLKKDYEISYYRDTKKITITVLGDYTLAKKRASLNELRLGLGKPVLTAEDYDLFYSAPVADGGSDTKLQDKNYNSP